MIYVTNAETKNTWARDDPAILVLISACLCGARVSWWFLINQSQCLHSICNSLGGSILLWDRGHLSTSSDDDFAGLLPFGIDYCHSYLVLCNACLLGVNWQAILRFTANRLLLSPPSHSTPADSHVEWAYALDVHTNAFFPLYLTLYLAQLFLLPIILRDNWVCLWVGNTLYLAAYAPHYYYLHAKSNLISPVSPSILMEFTWA